MADIVNLRRARKAKTRAAKEAEAGANRIRFGTPKAERIVAQAQAEREETALENKRLGGPAPSGETG